MPPKNSTSSSNAAAAAAAAGSTAQVALSATSASLAAPASGCSYATSFSPSITGVAADGNIELGSFYRPVSTSTAQLASSAANELVASAQSPMKKQKTTNDDENMDAFLEQFSPTKPEVMQAFNNKLMNEKKPTYANFKSQAKNQGKSPFGIELYSAAYKGATFPFMICFYGAYHLKEVLKGPKGNVNYLHHTLRSLQHGSFISAEYLSGDEKVAICNTNKPDSFSDTAFISDLSKPCNVICFGNPWHKTDEHTSTTDIINQAMKTKDFLLRELPNMKCPDFIEKENDDKKRKKVHSSVDGHFAVFYQEHTAVTTHELAFLRAVKLHLEDRWMSKNAGASEDDNADNTG